ncbi:hypothetical protein ACP70R_044489 [Stipagrostis hirtigluma subsp. patula]
MSRTAAHKGRETYEPRETMPPKRKISDDRRGGRAAKRPAPPPGKQHLYLLLDDWDMGYSVFKLDVDSFDSDADDLPPKRFAEPPVARIEAPHLRHCSFVSHGTKIFAMQPGEASPAIPAFDTHTLALTVCPWPSFHRDYGWPLFASAAGKLFLFIHDLAAYLGDPPPHGGKTPWSWTAIRARPPFYTFQVSCCALHPDGRTLFVSARQSDRSPAQGTFSFDAGRLEWTRHGDWLLPFAGQAYFDAELDAWVGLCGERDGGAGHLCSCDVTPVAAELTSPPSCNLLEEKLFRKEPGLHLSAKLVYMGDSKFCLVELLLHKDDEHVRRGRAKADGDGERRLPRRRRRVLSVTTFGLKYNRKAQLQTTLRRARACKVYNQAQDAWQSVDPLAFWL